MGELKVNGEPLKTWLPKFMSNYIKLVSAVEDLKTTKAIVFELQGTIKKLERDIFGLKAIIPEDKLNAFELGRGDKSIAEEIDKKINKEDADDLHKNSNMESGGSSWDKGRIFG
jgi:hypothetical protein